MIHLKVTDWRYHNRLSGFTALEWKLTLWRLFCCFFLNLHVSIMGYFFDDEYSIIIKSISISDCKTVQGCEYLCKALCMFTGGKKKNNLGNVNRKTRCLQVNINLNSPHFFIGFQGSRLKLIHMHVLYFGGVVFIRNPDASGWIYLNLEFEKIKLRNFWQNPWFHTVNGGYFTTAPCWYLLTWLVH